MHITRTVQFGRPCLNISGDDDDDESIGYVRPLLQLKTVTSEKRALNRAAAYCSVQVSIQVSWAYVTRITNACLYCCYYIE